ncbi:MAG: site-specific integrase, partial [Deltaproteobacteria bacterium]|nr:site-specific integrase [Deltaproteobacteria bacterium]
MSIYLMKDKGWRYDFVRQGIRYTEAGYNTKRQAKQAEAKRREELN